MVDKEEKLLIIGPGLTVLPSDSILPFLTMTPRKILCVLPVTV